MSDSATHRRPSSGWSTSARWSAPLAVLAGGLVGSSFRYGVLFAAPEVPGGFPADVLFVNIVGSFVLGLFLARRERAVGSLWSLSFWAIGVLGSFTTFSAFSVEVVELIDNGAAGVAAAYVAVSMVGGVLAAVLGLRAGSVGR